MSACKRKAINYVPEQQKRVKFSTEDLIDELKTLENEEIKTGVISCKKAIINIDNREIDLHNIDSELANLKLHFNESSSSSSIIDSTNNEINLKNKLNSQPLQRHLENINNQLLNFLGQSITTEQLGSKYQAIPYKLIIYQENDFRPPLENTLEDNLKNLLIITCPTNCTGGNIYFPQLKKKFIPQQNLNFLIFGITTQYKLSKITQGHRIIIKYKIFENPLQIELPDLTVINTEKLRTILKNITETNVLISIIEWNIVKKICDDIEINYKEVYSDEECPKIVYDELEDNEYEYYFLGWHDSDVDFGNFIENKTGFEVGTFINISKPKQIFKPVVRYYNPGYGPKETYYDVDYYPFILINPCKDVQQEEINNYPESQSEDEELDDEVWRINKFFSTIPF